MLTTKAQISLRIRFVSETPEEMFCHGVAQMFSFEWLCKWHQYNLTDKTKEFELRHDKTNGVTVRQAKTQISLDICPV